MGVSFKVAKAGTRYKPKAVFEAKEVGSEPELGCQRRGNEVDVIGLGDEVIDSSIAMGKAGLHLVSKDPEVSFSLSLFQGGFTIGKPNEFFSGVPKQLYPYDRVSDTLFCAIESGHLPGEILDDLPCKYVNGALLCEIQDYRNSMPRNGDTSSSVENSPIRSKVLLRMCTESVVKDISLISDDSWTYNDLLEFESRVLRALRPDLELDPMPMLNRLCEESQSEKLNLGVSCCRKRRKLNDAFTVDHISSNASPRIEASEVCAHGSKFQIDGEFQDGVSYIEQLIPNFTSTSQRNNTHHENMPHSSLLTCQSDFQLAVDQSLHGAYVGPTLYGGPIHKIPMTEPRVTSQEELPNKQAPTKPSTKSKLKVQSLNVGARDNRPTLDWRTGGSNPLQAQPSQALGFVKADVLANRMQLRPACQSAVKNMTQEAVTVGQRGDNLLHSRVSSGANSSLPSRLSNFLPRQASFPTKGQNYSLKGLSENSVESIAGTNATNNSSSLSLWETPFPWPSVMEDAVLQIPRPIDSVLSSRFLKVEQVALKYALNKKKWKLDQLFERKSIFGTPELLSSHLLNLEDKNLKDGETNATSHAECYQDDNPIKTRKFTFERTSHAAEGNGAASIKAQVDVTIIKKLDEALVEITPTSGHEDFNPISHVPYKHSVAFANMHHADLFAAQFTSLMISGGYQQCGEQMGIAAQDIARSSSTHPQIFLSTATTAAEIVDLVPPTPNAGQSPYPLNAANSRISVSTFIPRHVSSQNNFSGGHLLPSSANIQSALPLPTGYFSSSPLELASQFSPMHPQWQHIMNRRAALLQLQMQERERLQQELWKRSRMMTGRFCPNPGTLQIGSEVHGARNVGINSTSGDPWGYMSLLGGGNIQGTGRSSGKNTPSAVMASRIRMTENGGGALMSGFSVDGRAGVGPSNLPMMENQTTNWQPSLIQVQHHHLYMQKSEEMRKLIQLQEVTGLTEHVCSPLSSSSLVQIEQQCQMSPQGLMPHQLDSGNITMDHGSPGLDSRTPGSV